MKFAYCFRSSSLSYCQTILKNRYRSALSPHSSIICTRLFAAAAAARGGGPSSSLFHAYRKKEQVSNGAVNKQVKPRSKSSDSDDYNSDFLKPVNDKNEKYTSFTLPDDDANELHRLIGFNPGELAGKKDRKNIVGRNDSRGEDGQRKRDTVTKKKFLSRDTQQPPPLSSQSFPARKEAAAFETGSKQTLASAAPEKDYFSLKNIRGFLDINPFICNGCGTAFQYKHEDAPGFLPEDKFIPYRRKAELLQKQQQAVSLLTMADIPLDSTTAEETLRKAKVDEIIIRAIKKLGQRLQGIDEELRVRLEESKEAENEPIPLVNEYLKAKKEGNLRIADSATERNHGGINITTGDDSSDKAEIIPSQLPSDSTNDSTNDSSLTSANMTSSSDLPPTVVLESKPTENDEDDLDKLPICQRCYRLQQYGQVESSLRPGWSKNELLTPERFEKLLSSIKDTPATVLCIVDIFDLHGSLLKNLKEIVGSNPLYIAVNKVDLLPKDISRVRVIQWIYSEIQRICGFETPKQRYLLSSAHTRDVHRDRDSHSRDRERNRDGEYREGKERRSGEDESRQQKFKGKKENNDFDNEIGVFKQANIHLISCNQGYGITALMKDLFDTAVKTNKKIYVMGAANVGKSSFINRIMHPSYYRKINKARSSQKSKNKPTQPIITVSNLPGTTLDFLKMKLSNDITMIDTPGLINRGHLTSKLTPKELKQVIPSKQINAVTFRLDEGRCILLGGLGKLEVLEVSDCFLVVSCDHFLVFRENLSFLLSLFLTR
jgi:ribosome biogenesis GTPase A